MSANVPGARRSVTGLPGYRMDRPPAVLSWCRRAACLGRQQAGRLLYGKRWSPLDQRHLAVLEDEGVLAAALEVGVVTLLGGLPGERRHGDGFRLALPVVEAQLQAGELRLRAGVAPEALVPARAQPLAADLAPLLVALPAVLEVQIARGVVGDLDQGVRRPGVEPGGVAPVQLRQLGVHLR